MKNLIVTAGMPRSGSTWLYNVIRLLMQETSLDIGAGWIGDFNTFKDHDIVILKIHNFEEVIAKKATYIFYSFRDIRDALASFKRKFNSEPSIEQARTYINHDALWKKCAHYSMRYETMIESQKSTISEIASILQIPNPNIPEIIENIRSMTYGESTKTNGTYNLENLLHKGHITNGKHGSWYNDLPKELVIQIEEECSSWLQTNNYLQP